MKRRSESKAPAKKRNIFSFTLNNGIVISLNNPLLLFLLFCIVILLFFLALVLYCSLQSFHQKLHLSSHMLWICDDDVMQCCTIVLCYFSHHSNWAPFFTHSL